MATLTKSWQNIKSWQWNPGTGFKITYYIDAKYSSQSVANNTSTVQTRLTCVVNSGSGGGNNYKFTCTYAPTVSGSGYYTFTTRNSSNPITSGSSTVTHNSDGTKSITISAQVKVTGVGLGHTLSATVSLPKINRDFTSTPSISSSDITAESVKINWSTSQACDLIKYKLNNGSWVQAWTGNASSGNFTISGLNSNTSYTIVGDFRRRDTGRTKNSNTITIKTKPRPIRIYIDGAWKVAKPYVRVDGVWKEAKPYVRVDGVWKEGN